MSDHSTPIDAPARVLIADDEDFVRDLLSDALAADGEPFEFHNASDGEQARQLVEAHDFDVVITDLNMPGMDGLSLMQWAHENRPGPSWIILTGYGTFETAIRAVKLGAFDFVTKPLNNMDNFKVTVRNALRQRRLSAERDVLLSEVEQSNQRLQRKVAQLESAYKLLREQSEIISADLHRAELIQRALLPADPPQLEQLSIDAIYRTSQTVGGDLYAVVRLDDRYAAAFVADAAGHGVSAAMLSVLFRHRLPLLDHDYRPNDPSAALTAVNQHVLEQCVAPGLFITAAMCLIDVKEQEITVASAGHPPALLRRSDGTLERIYHTGPALGITPQAQFAQKRLKYHLGDRLLLYTDGLCSSQKGNPLTVDDICRTLGDPVLSGGKVLRSLWDEFSQRHEDSAQEDDVTMLMLSAEPLESSIDNGAPAARSADQQFYCGTEGEVLLGQAGEEAMLCVRGRGVWTYCDAFHQACSQQMDKGLDLRLDLSVCEYLDSTFLGTILEIVDRARRKDRSIVIQGVMPVLRADFEELGMQRVLDRMTTEMVALPTRMERLGPSDDEEAGRQRMLQAHQILSSLSEDNRQQFQKLVDILQLQGG